MKHECFPSDFLDLWGHRSGNIILFGLHKVHLDFIYIHMFGCRSLRLVDLCDVFGWGFNGATQKLQT